MATSSFFHNIIIDTDEKAKGLVHALDASEKWSKAHPAKYKDVDETTFLKKDSVSAFAKKIKL
jgi:hypothetical protein